MQLVQRIQIDSTPLLEKCAVLSNALYNVATFSVRQYFFNTGKWKRYLTLYHELKIHEHYRVLSSMCGAQTAQQVLRQVDTAFKIFFLGLKSFKTNPSKFLSKPKLPRYRKKGKYYNLLIFTNQRSRIKDGLVYLTRNIHSQGFKPIPTNLRKIDGVRIVPWADRFQIELIYSIEPQNPEVLGLKVTNRLGIDIGVNNIISAIDNRGFVPFIIKGGVVKSINQYYNKKLGKYTSSARKCNDTNITKRILRLRRMRNNKIYDKFHKISRKVIEICIEREIGTIVIGYNKGWKQYLKLLKKTNQNFAYIPYWKLVAMLEYKAKLVGIEIHKVTEEYTSQICSRCGVRRKANRKHRGLYVCKQCGSVINADVNAACNIISKEFPETTWLGDRGCVDHPLVFPIH